MDLKKEGSLPPEQGLEMGVRNLPPTINSAPTAADYPTLDIIRATQLEYIYIFNYHVKILN